VPINWTTNAEDLNLFYGPFRCRERNFMRSRFISPSTCTYGKALLRGEFSTNFETYRCRHVERVADLMSRRETHISRLDHVSGDVYVMIELSGFNPSPAWKLLLVYLQEYGLVKYLHRIKSRFRIDGL
jgi:hypothetical protein